MTKESLHIDVEALIKSKSPRLSHWIPRFFYNWIKKIIHENDINRIIKETEGLKDEVFTSYVIKNEAKVTVNTIGLENIPKTGGVILASNHPLGGLDGMILMMEVAKVRKDIRVIVNDLLALIPNYGEIFIPVNKLGKNAKLNLQKVEEAYQQGFLVLVFPAGLCSRKTQGEVKDVAWQKSFISRALKYNLPVIPIHFSGQNSNRFYNWANFRKFLGIKINIEMFFLVDELYLQKGKKFNIQIGKPIAPETFSSKHSMTQWADIVRNYVYHLAKSPETTFDDYLTTLDKQG